MKIHVIVQILVVLIMLFMGAVFSDQTAVFMSWVLIAGCAASCVSMVIGIK